MLHIVMQQKVLSAWCTSNRVELFMGVCECTSMAGVPYVGDTLKCVNSMLEEPATV